MIAWVTHALLKYRPHIYISPFEILEKIGPNAYKVDLPGEYGISATFNVADLSPYYDESEEIPSLRPNSSQVREDDGDQPIKDPKEAKKVKEVQEAAKDDAKEVQLMARNALALSDSLSASSSKTWPGFVRLMKLDPGEIIFCTHAPPKA